MGAEERENTSLWGVCNNGLAGWVKPVQSQDSGDSLQVKSCKLTVEDFIFRADKIVTKALQIRLHNCRTYTRQVAAFSSIYVWLLIALFHVD